MTSRRASPSGSQNSDALKWAERRREKAIHRAALEAEHAIEAKRQRGPLRKHPGAHERRAETNHQKMPGTWTGGMEETEEQIRPRNRNEPDRSGFESPETSEVCCHSRKVERRAQRARGNHQSRAAERGDKKKTIVTDMAPSELASSCVPLLCRALRLDHYSGSVVSSFVSSPGVLTGRSWLVRFLSINAAACLRSIQCSIPVAPHVRVLLNTQICFLSFAPGPNVCTPHPIYCASDPQLLSSASCLSR